MRLWNLKAGDKVLFTSGEIIIPEDILYVDSEVGNDMIGDGTCDNPFKTMNKAASYSPSAYIICRGYFDENASSIDRNFVADREFDTVYSGIMPLDRHPGFNMINNWIFYYSNCLGNRGYNWSITGFMKDVGQKYFAVKRNKFALVCSSYKQDVTLSWGSEGYNANTGCIEQAVVSINTFVMTGYCVLKNCIIYIDGCLFEPTGETDEEQTMSLRTRLGNETVRITSGPLFNDPENGDLTLHPDSVALQNKMYLNSDEYVYPAAFPPALPVKILLNSTGEKYAFDERTIIGGVLISENQTIEPVRDSLGQPVGSGRIDSKVITLNKGTTLRGLNLIFDNDELNAGLRLGQKVWQTLQVRFKQSITYTSDVSSLIQGAVYLNSNTFNIKLKNNITNVEREVAPGESLVLKPNESVVSQESGIRLGIVFTDDTGWIDCLCNNDLLVIRVDDVPGGAMDTDVDGNVLTNANPNSYSEVNKHRPVFPVSAKYVQYRLNMILRNEQI